MNLLLRYLILCLMLKSDKAKSSKPSYSDAIIRYYRILPHDMGFRHHVPNYRYLSFIELNIQQWLMQQRPMDELGWVIASQQLTYIKESFLFDKLTLRSQLLAWDKKYLYFRHEFWVKNDLNVVALTKIVLMLDGQVQPTNVIVQQDEQTHPVIKTWQDNLNEIKKLTPIK